MQIEIKIDETLSEPRIIIMTNKITDEISELMQRLAEETPRLLAGFKKETVSLLEQEKIIRIYAANSKVFAVTEDDEYQVRLRLYELEDRLDRKFFVRISNSEIINLRKIEEFDMSFTGTICVSLSNGAVTYVSRRYIAKIKQLLGL
ncbi:LytTR family DNA-binding domain-containing protein [[Clostridium] symbiosum]|uniref:LytTR family DNA-binding domain-containing protein n=1 Tax=Clostridium symbiosum TaxID=1512 RepID=UPI0034A0E46A